MNFNLVRQAEGKTEVGKDGHQYQVKLAMLGTPTIIEPVKFTPEGKRTQQVTIVDAAGESQKVKIFLGRERTMGDGCIGRRLAFDISPYTSEKNGQTYYSGFWNDRATVAPAKAGINAPQSPQVASKPPTPTQTTPQVDWGAKDLRMAKMNALKCATEKQVIMADIAKNLNFVTDDKIIEIAEKFVNWIYTKGETAIEKEAGDLLKKPTYEENPDYVGDNPAEPSDDGIPF